MERVLLDCGRLNAQLMRDSLGCRTMTYSALCDHCRTLAEMWLLTVGFILPAVALIVWRRPLVIVAALAWVPLTLNQLGYLSASTPPPLTLQVLAAAALALIVPVLTWVYLEWRNPDDGLYGLVVSSRTNNPRGSRLILGVVVGCLLAGGPAYVLQALGLRVWALIILIIGVLLVLLFGEVLFRKAAA